MLKHLYSYLVDYKPALEQAKALFSASPAFLSLLLVNVLVFMGETIWPNAFQHLFLWHNSFTATDGLTLLALVQMFTCMFCHANFGHIFGNFFFGAPFALWLEHKLGSKKFLQWWILCGFGGSLLWVYSPHLLPWGACLGASGAICGVMAAACMLQEKLGYKVLGLLGCGLFLWVQLCSMVAGMGMVANAAHVGGMLTALLLICWSASKHE